MRIPDIHWQIPELFLSYLSPLVDTHFKAKTASLLIYHVCSKARRNSPSADGSTTGVWVLHRFKPILGYALIHSIHHRKGEKNPFFLLNQLCLYLFLLKKEKSLMFSLSCLSWVIGEAIALGFQHYILSLGTAVMIPTLLVPMMGGDDVRIIEASSLSSLLFSFHFRTSLPHWPTCVYKIRVFFYTPFFLFNLCFIETGWQGEGSTDNPICDWNQHFIADPLRNEVANGCWRLICIYRADRIDHTRFLFVPNSRWSYGLYNLLILLSLYPSVCVCVYNWTMIIYFLGLCLLIALEIYTKHESNPRSSDSLIKRADYSGVQSVVGHLFQVWFISIVGWSKTR